MVQLQKEGLQGMQAQIYVCLECSPLLCLTGQHGEQLFVSMNFDSMGQIIDTFQGLG